MTAFREGPLAGIGISAEVFHNTHKMSYTLIGWTPDGVPTQERTGCLWDSRTWLR